MSWPGRIGHMSTRDVQKRQDIVRRLRCFGGELAPQNETLLQQGEMEGLGPWDLDLLFIGEFGPGELCR
jgi:hypothetical protein